MSITAPGWGSLDQTHTDAVRAAHRLHERGYADARSIGASLAVFEGQQYGTEHAGVYLMAFCSTLDALDLEQRDRQEAFRAVADAWWADPAHQRYGATTYGAPWSPPARLVRRDSNVQPGAHTPDACLAV